MMLMSNTQVSLGLGSSARRPKLLNEALSRVSITPLDDRQKSVSSTSQFLESRPISRSSTP